MNASTRLTAAIVAGLLPAVVAFIVMMVVNGNPRAALVTAMIIGVGMAVISWMRYGSRPPRE